MQAYLKKILDESDIFQYGLIKPSQVRYLDEVRELCHDNCCGCYGTTWACPPAVGSVEDCRARCLRFEHMVIFSIKYNIKGSFDYEGMRQAMADFKKSALKLDDDLRDGLSDYVILSNESCDRCQTCTYPDEPCRFPEQLHHSIEGYGIYVHEVAKLAGVVYNNGPDTVTFFGAILYN